MKNWIRSVSTVELREWAKNGTKEHGQFGPHAKQTIDRELHRRNKRRKRREEA